MFLYWIDKGDTLNSRAGHVLMRDRRIRDLRIGAVEVGPTVIVFHNTVGDALRLRLATGDTSRCTSCPDIFQIYVMGSATDEFRSIEIAVCRECAKGIWDYHHVRDDGQCKCQQLCGCRVCNELAEGHTPQVSINPDDAEAGVDPERRPRAVSPAETLPYSNESSPSPRVTGDFTSLDGAAVGPPRAAAAASTLDARGAVSIVLKELDQKDRLIAMLRRQYEEVVMERDHEKEVKDVLIEKVGVYLTCPVTLQEMQAKMLQGVCGHMLSVQAVQGMLRQQGINPFAVEPPYSLPCPLCRQTSLFGPAIGIGPLVEAALEARSPCALPVQPPSTNPMDFAYNSPSDSD